MWCISTCTCRRLCLNSACSGFEHFNNPIQWNHNCPSPFHPLAQVNLPLFINDFHLEMEVTLDQEAFIFTLACSSCLSSTIFEVQCMNFYKILLSQSFYEWFWFLFGSMWTCCVWSCSPIHIAFDCDIMNTNFRIKN